MDSRQTRQYADRSVVIDAIKFLRELVPVESTTAFVSLVAVLGALVCGGAALAVDRVQKKASAEAAARATAAQRAVIRTRPLFSDRQIIKWTGSLGPVGQLNLDNVASFICVIPPNKTTIRLFEQGTTAVKIAQPQRDTKVTLPGGMTASFPAAGTPGISISHAIVVGTNREFVFDTDANRQHDITVGSRTFHVRLDSIENRSTRTMGDMEFAFAITEEP